MYEKKFKICSRFAGKGKEKDLSATICDTILLTIVIKE